MAKYNLDDVIREIELCKPQGFNSVDFRSWLFEYACQVCEYEDLHPASNPAYLNWIMVNKAYSVKEQIVSMYHRINTNPKKAIQFTLADRKLIPYLVKQEHEKK